MKHFYKIMALFLLLVVIGGQCGYAMNDTIIVRNYTDTTVCESYEWYGIEYAVPGDYGTRVDSVGDTIYVDSLHLTINHATTGIDEQVACDSFTWIDSVIYTESNDTATYTLTNAAGCDSVVTLHLTVNHPAHFSTTIDTCESYTWTDGNGQTYTTSGDYTYSHEDANGCMQVDTLHLIINRPTYGDTTAVACGSFRWHGYSNLTESGEYTDTLTNAVGCDSVVTLHLIILKPTHTSIKVTECDSFTWPANGETYIQSNDYTYIHTDSNGCTQVDTLHLTIYNPVHAAVTVEACESYTWTEGTGATYTTSDTYTYAHQDTHGCWQVDTLHLTINHPVTVHFDTAICSSSLPLTWHDTTFEVGTVSGDYILHRKTVQNCDSIITLTLTVNPLPTVIISGEGSFCQGNSTMLTASGASSYAWDNGSQNATTTVSTEGTYIVTGTDANGCANTTSKTVTVNPTYNIPISASICQGDTFNFFGQSLTAASSYSHTLYTSKGCDSVITLILTVNPLPNVTISGDTSICQGQTTTLTASDAVAYLWSNGGTIATSIVNAAGTYRVTCTNTYGCTASADKSVIVDTLPMVTISGNSSFCHGTSTLLTASGAYSYEWSNGSLLASTTVGMPATYTVTGTDSHGCSSSATLIVTENPLPNITVAGNSAFCQGDSIVLMASGADSYSWSTGSNLSSTTINVAGNYTVTGTNTYQCTASVTKTVSMNTLPNITISGASSFCQGTSTTLTASGASTYAWSNGSTTNETTVNYAGFYMVTASDANGCRNTDSLLVTEIPAQTSSISATGCEEYTWNGTVYYTSGDYTQTLTAASGCDSIVTLHLTIHHGTHNVFTETACESYTWHGQTYTASGTYTYPYNNEYDCPSVDTLHLTIHHGTHNVFTKTECEKYIWHGEAYTASGTYTYSYNNADGCASADTLHLTIHTPVHTATSLMNCNSYTWTEGTGMTYTTSGTYTYAHPDANGCTQVDTLHLIILSSVYTEVSVTECGNYYWNDNNYTTSGDYTGKFSAANGCDSIVTLHLTIIPALQDIKNIVSKKRDGIPYMLVYPDANLQYQWYKNGVAINNATKQYYYPADYELESSLEMDACYQVLVAAKEPGTCGTYTDCWVDVPSQSAKIRILPNPNDGQFRLMLPEGTVNVQILNANGQVVMSRKVDGDNMQDMSTALANGLYFVKSFRQDGSFDTEKLIINR